jgi:tetratricopeptide (TPR) repeat protein
MAACARGDHPAGIDCWTRYLPLSPDPVYRPDAFYHRGECYRHLGRLDEARADYQAAVAMDIDTHFFQLARRRLSELELS